MSLRSVVQRIAGSAARPGRAKLIGAALLGCAAATLTVVAIGTAVLSCWPSVVVGSTDILVDELGRNPRPGARPAVPAPAGVSRMGRRPATPR